MCVCVVLWTPTYFFLRFWVLFCQLSIQRGHSHQRRAENGEYKGKKSRKSRGGKNNINRLLLLEIIKYRVFHCGSWLIKKTVKSLQQTICLLKKVLAKTRIKHWVNYSWIMFKMIPCISLIQAPPDHRLKGKCCYLGTTESCSSTEKLFAILKLSSSSQALLTSKSTTEFPNREVTKQHI